MDPVTTTPSPAVRALQYAENQLGVHLVYEDAIKNRDLLDGMMTEIGDARDKKRIIEAKVQDREFEIMADERGKHADLSVAAMERHLKLAYHGDPSLQELRAQHVAVVNDLDGLELDRSVLEVDIKIATARLMELGGYFQYLAAVKNQATKTDETSEASQQ